MGSGQSDFYRTRLTHSLEAAQIGSGITAQLRCKYPELSKALFPESDSLIETICLAHDIGHPPFGHGGEVALNYMMRNHGGFEGNGQTLRIVARLET
jgi:dGTPase